MLAGKSFTHRVKPDHNVFAYVIDGEAFFDQRRAPLRMMRRVITILICRHPVPAAIER